MTRVAIIAAALLWPVAAPAQDFWANTLPSITGTDTLGTTLREKERSSSSTSSARAAPAPSRRAAVDSCSIDALSASEKDALYARYKTVKRERGDAAADAWIKAEGRALYNRMAAQGRC